MPGMKELSDLLRYVDPDHGWTPGQPLQDAVSAVLTVLEDRYAWVEADSAMVIMVLRLAFVALVPGNTVDTATALLLAPRSVVVD